MNLGQTLLVLAALSMLGILALTSNTSLLDSQDVQNRSEAGITAVSLATSLVEEAAGLMFDQVIADTFGTALSSPSSLTQARALGRDGSEAYRSATNGFNDIDDFHGLVVVFKNVADSARTPGSHAELTLPGLRAKYIARARVEYVSDAQLDRAVSAPTWHKKMTISVTSPGNPAMPDSLVFPFVMSYWN